MEVRPTGRHGAYESARHRPENQPGQSDSTTGTHDHDSERSLSAGPAATRAAVTHWGLEVLCQEPKDFSPVLTAVLMPPGHDADEFRKIVLDNYNMSLGSGLSKVAGKVFRIGHLGECNELTLLAALTGVEMGLSVAGVPHRAGGVDVAMKALEQRHQGNSPLLKVVGH